jgi:hypothetical protein
MNNEDRFESEMRSWLREQAPRQAPEGLLARGLAAVRQTSQYRGWLSELARLRSVQAAVAGVVVLAGVLAALALLDLLPLGTSPGASPPPEISCPLGNGCGAETDAVLGAVAKVPHRVSRIAFGKGLICLADPFHPIACPVAPEPPPKDFIGSAVVEFVGTPMRAYLNLYRSGQGPITNRMRELVPPASSAAVAAHWTSLRWSAPVPLPDGGIVSELTRWQDAYVAVGQVAADQVVGAVFRSVDGLHWTHLDTGKAFEGSPPVRILASAGRLLAMGNPPEPICDRQGEGAVCKPSGPAPLWVSDDARTWLRVDPAPFAGTSPSRLAARPDGFVVVGETFGGKAAIWHSSDGIAWARVALPSSFDHAILMNVASTPGGYLAVGRDGAPDVAMPGGAAYNPGIGLPAAWWSADGLNWIAASVEAEQAPGAQLLNVMAGSDGLLVIGSDSTDPHASARTAAGWVSTDGRTWTRIDAAAFATRPYGSIAGSNGAQIVTIGPKLVGGRYDPDTLGAWVSTNGIEWRSLPISGFEADLPGGDVSSLAKAHIDQMLVVPGGLIVLGQNGGLGEIAWWVDASGG